MLLHLHFNHSQVNNIGLNWDVSYLNNTYRNQVSVYTRSQLSGPDIPGLVWSNIKMIDIGITPQNCLVEGQDPFKKMFSTVCHAWQDLNRKNHLYPRPNPQGPGFTLVFP